MSVGRVGVEVGVPLGPPEVVTHTRTTESLFSPVKTPDRLTAVRVLGVLPWVTSLGSPTTLRSGLTVVTRLPSLSCETLVVFSLGVPVSRTESTIFGVKTGGKTRSCSRRCLRLFWVSSSLLVRMRPLLEMGPTLIVSGVDDIGVSGSSLTTVIVQTTMTTPIVKLSGDEDTVVTVESVAEGTPLVVFLVELSSTVSLGMVVRRMVVTVVVETTCSEIVMCPRFGPSESFKTDTTPWVTEKVS